MLAVKRTSFSPILFIIIVLLIASWMLSGCSPSSATRTLSLPNRQLTIKQISDHPFYELHYQGDYGFGDFIRTGREINASRIPLNEDPIFSCSCFSALGDPQQILFGRNFDWYDHSALILFTDPPGGYASVSMVDISYLGYDRQHSPLDDPQALVRAPYLPFDGMNEHGLAVGMMAISHAEGGVDKEKITLDELELIRLMLDYARDVPEALKLLEKYNVDFGSSPVHYLLADASGNSGVVEFLAGVPVVVRTNQSWQVATNFLISEEKPDGANSSCFRYNHLARTLNDTGGKLNMREGMELLQDVSQRGETATRWSIIYDLSNKSVSLAMGRNYNTVFSFSIQKDG